MENDEGKIEYEQNCQKWVLWSKTESTVCELKMFVGRPIEMLEFNENESNFI